MNYRIITDEAALRAFIDWLPEQEPHEKYYYCLFARGKYSTAEEKMNTDSVQLKRGVTDKAGLLSKLRQLEVPLGAYAFKGVPIPQECLAVYIMVNPRDLETATLNTLVRLAKCVRDKVPNVHPHKEALSEIQVAKSRSCYLDFDIDCTDEAELQQIIRQIEAYVNPEAVTLLRTRGGIHCLIDPAKVTETFKKGFFQKIAQLPGVDKTGDQMIPVPGCTQGGFTPYFMV